MAAGPKQSIMLLQSAQGTPITLPPLVLHLLSDTQRPG